MPATKKAAGSAYTDPALRERLKKKITAGTKGGRAGQWSARKAQLLAAEYAKAGGGYTKGKRTAAQNSLSKWTHENWRTADGAKADRPGGTARYLPAKAWDELTPAEQKATDAKKRAASKTGKQFVANTKRAKAAGKKARAK